MNNHTGWSRCRNKNQCHYMWHPAAQERTLTPDSWAGWYWVVAPPPSWWVPLEVYLREPGMTASHSFQLLCSRHLRLGLVRWSTGDLHHGRGHIIQEWSIDQVSAKGSTSIFNYMHYHFLFKADFEMVPLLKQIALISYLERLSGKMNCMLYKSLFMLSI